MSWTNAVDTLRQVLSDGPTDRLRYRKKCFGEINGLNTSFKTFEFRRVTDFTTAVAPFGVYVNGALVTVATDYIGTGDFELAVAPADGTSVEASYYLQWFTNAELETFLGVASSWLGIGSTYVNVADGLQPAALRFAASEAYMKLALRWREAMSETYRVEDAPDGKQNSVVDEYLKLAESFKESARGLRDDFYTRQGQSLAPLFGTILGAVGNPQPRS